MNFYKYKLVFYPEGSVDETETCVGIATARNLSNVAAVVISAICSEGVVESIEVAPISINDDTGVIVLANEDAIKQFEDTISC